ncbi:PilZ domain-containing protein [Pelagibacterium sp.]|uniref:PilZ domain-containing protein n=1 Tax=Pelagibacterium sp. TaxID=1967288 RepID=UPI003A91C31D
MTKANRSKGRAEPARLDDRLRLMTNMPGRYHLEKWPTTKDKTSYFACRVQRISPVTMSLAAPIGGDVGDWVSAHFDEFGVLRGQITRPMGFGFTMSLAMPDEERERLASHVQWLEQHKNFEVSEHRRYRRVTPKDPQSTIILGDGTMLDCFVIDISMTGAAVSADIEVKIGMAMALGTVVGRVVRVLDPGFAIEFLTRVDFDALEHKLICPRLDLRKRLLEDV